MNIINKKQDTENIYIYIYQIQTKRIKKKPFLRQK